MAKCEYSRYKDWSDRCVIKGSLEGSEDDKVGSATYKEYCQYSEGYKKCPFYAQKEKDSNSSSDCFLTSACVRAKGLPDNCQELQTLRAFRDGWLKAQTYGAESIEEYYRIAPTVVMKIDARRDADRIYSAIYAQVILPCIEFIQAQKNEEAFALYKSATMELLSALE